MKKISLILFIGLLGFSVQAQVAQIVFDETVIDYGDIQKGDDGVRTFTFTNTGDAPLLITDIRSTCGCTVPRRPQAPIMPGESDFIEVKYDTNRVGPIRRSISVYSNAEDSIVTLNIRGNVRQ